ncbi:MAG: protease modulator HflC [Pseudomonadota bacterium]
MKNQSLPIIIIGAAVISLIAVSQIFFTVPETSQALVLRFGEVRRVHQEAGLKWKYPLIESYIYIDKRNLELDQDQQEVVAADQERLIVDAFARFRITEPVLFYQSVNNEVVGRQRLSTLMDQSLRSVLGTVNTEDIISGQRAELMGRIQSSLEGGARRLGMEVLDVKIRRADLPPENSQAVYGRMQSERQQEARQIRAEGQEESLRITSSADADVIEIKAKAEEEAQKLRGQADATRNAVFADAYGANPEFFSFYRSLLAYEQALASGDSTIVLSPDSEFFRYLGDINGRPGR